MSSGEDTLSSTMVRVIACNEVEGEFPTRVELPGLRPLACYRLGDDFFVTDDICSHGDASLADGEILPSGEVVCPFHNGTFDIRTGEARRYPCEVAIRTYPVCIRDEAIWIDGGPAAYSDEESLA